MQKCGTLVLKIMLSLLLIYSILNILEVKFKIKPCPDNESCRNCKIVYLDDEKQQYKYKKESMKCSEEGVCYKQVCDDINHQCNNFIFIVVFLAVSFGILNYFYFNQDCMQSIFIGLSIVIFMTFFPLNTLHAVNSNDYCGALFRDSMGKKFTFKTEKVNNA